jgi:hypothetical protein
MAPPLAAYLRDDRHVIGRSDTQLTTATSATDGSNTLPEHVGSVGKYLRAQAMVFGGVWFRS